MASNLIELHPVNFRLFRATLLGATQKEMSELFEVSEVTIRSIERDTPKGSYVMRQSRAATIADSMGITLDEFAAVFGVTKWEDQQEIKSRPWFLRLRDRLRAMRAGTPETPGTSIADVVVPIRRVPFFDLTIPAGGWSEPCDGRSLEDADGFVDVPSTTPTDAFAVRIRGDSMTPEFPDGSILVFEPIGPENRKSRFVPGKPYHFQNDDDQCTFKIVTFEPQKKRFRLDSLNKRYKPIYVAGGKMRRVSRAILLVRSLV